MLANRNVLRPIGVMLRGNLTLVAFLSAVALTAHVTRIPAQDPTISDSTYKLRFSTPGFVRMVGSTPTGPALNAPRESRFRFTNIDSDGFRYVEFTDVASDDLAKVQDQVLKTRAALRIAVAVAGSRDGSPEPGIVKIHERYRVPATELGVGVYDVVVGWVGDAGAIAIPFKLQTSDWRLTAGGSLGAYGGVKRGRWTLLGVAGLALLSTSAPSTATNPNPPPDSKPGLTLALGALLHVAGPFSFAAIGGVDLGVDRSVYTYAKKPWISISIGSSFISQ